MKRWGRSLTYTILVLVVIALGEVPTSAQPYGWGPFDFGEDWVALVPPPLPSGLSASHVFEDWGVTISSGSVQGPRTGTLSEVPHVNLVTPIAAPVILNGSESEVSAGGMTINFDEPVRRVSLNMGAESETNVVARFFDRSGTFLGEDTGTLYGIYPDEFALEDADGAGIVRVEVEYEETDVPEALNLIVAEYVEPRPFQRCVSQVAQGAMPFGDRTLQTLLTITGSWNRTFFRIPDGQAQIYSLEFRDLEGAPLTVNLDGTVNSEFELLSSGYMHRYLESRILRTLGSGRPLDQGYACATSKYPFELAAVYRVLDSTSAPLAEAGIDSSIPGQSFTGVFEKTLAEDTNTALALANVSDSEATASVTFFMSPNTTMETEVVLGPGEQGAWFADELAEALSGRDAEGTVEIISDEPVAVTILRTIQGVVSASLPLRRVPAGPAK